MIEVQRLTKRFGSVLAVDDLSFGVQPGLVTGFLGPNGAGKSTTLRMILGLDTPSDGQAIVHGRRYQALPHPLRTVGSLLDASAVQGGRSARAHLSWLAASNDLPSSRVAEVLQTTGLTEVAHRRIGTFSLGMRQRLGIAAALLGDPQVLILDEPVNGLDPDGIIWIRGLLAGLAAQGCTVLISSHLISELERCADHLIVIGQGRLLADATVSQFIAAHGMGDVLVRTPSPERLTALLRAHGASVTPAGPALAIIGLAPEQISTWASAEAIPLHELTARTPSMEQAYLALSEETLQYRGSQPVTSEGQVR
ncbi:MAG: ATP-binding cassette domain-containing protein [Actinomycetota bacterium]|nr:ATP-binding cassette domain-containing protein [Actinomycetota bacterium]MDQ2956329.1 ATP-binding cassette domain-containing protein [Actinomycetota bacterium]